jgi:hypothetical protein
MATAMLAVALGLLPPVPAAHADPDIEGSLDQIEAIRALPADALLGAGPARRLLGPYDRLRQSARESLGLDYLVYYSQLFQQGSEDLADDRLLVGQLHALARWELLEHERFGESALGVYFVDVRELLGNPPSQFSDATDSSFLVNDGEDSFASLKQLFWEQRLLAGRLDIIAGQIELQGFMNGNSYADDDSYSFVAQPLSTNPVTALPPAGLGAYLELRPSAHGYFSLAFVDANANGKLPDFDTFAKGEYVFAAELGWTPSFDGIGGGAYRFTAVRADATASEPSGSGFALSFEQQLGAAWGLFLRYQSAWGRKPALQASLGAGAVWTRPFGRRRDWLGLAFFWGDPSQRDRSDELGVETYWRLQLSDRLELTPDLQVHVHPDRGDGLSLVGGLRLRLAL